MQEDKKTVEIFTDGACSGNPGKGGWGAILRFKDKVKELSGFEPETTNNRMELTAVIKALEIIKFPCNIIISTDSQYVAKGITEWLPKWKLKDWRNANKKPVKNADLWQVLDKLASAHEIKWLWVKGHAGHAENERCDELATKAILNHDIK